MATDNREFDGYVANPESIVARRRWETEDRTETGLSNFV